MGRRNRSSSIGNTKEAARPRSSSISATPGIDTDACNALFNHFLHDKDQIGRTFLHNAVHAASSNTEQQSDGYYLMDAICKRAKELDKIVKEKSKGASVSHMHKLMLTKDEENGYTPLHYAILRRDLTSLLLLLKHASTELEDEDGLMNVHNQQMQHPLRLLDSRGDDEGIFRVMKDLAASLDNETLSPLRLLGETSANDLEKCRQTMHWSYLKQIWKKQTQTANAISDEDSNPRMRRQRMISFGDERDYLNNDVDDSPVNNRLGRGSRSGSFHVDDMDHEEDDEEEGQAGANADLLPLGDVDFTLLVEPDGVKVQKDEVLTVGNESVDFGCELYTFGRADHCALGVPQFGTAGKRDRQFDDGFEAGSSKNAASHKPRRVEAFALGDMRREWSDPKAAAAKEKDAVDSPVVAVAAAAHHTLAVTRGGRLFAFGLGKGGRLGTGDENHRPLPTRILGPLSKRIVTSIAASENHSLCATAFDGGCYSWGSNGFGQLGMPSDQNQDSRLSPRRVDDLKSVSIVAVSAGDRHSVALSKTGEVYCWGDNRSGQCAGSPPVSSPSSVNRNCHRPTRVEALTGRVCIAISASEFSTLALTRPPTNGEASLASLPVNVVFGWGHGSHIPLKVNFPTTNSNQTQTDSTAFSRSTCVNPVSIASAKYHNVAISADGRVYTWGISSESLGLERGKNQSVNAPPQLVVGMLPEKGGGRAVAVSASESHTAVITASGHLYTWGSSYGQSALGHKGVKWQPSPRKVKRVHRAVGLAVAKEHTALLIGTSFPSLPHCSPSSDSNLLSLKDSAAVEISRNVDISNVLPIASVAQQLNSRSLVVYCEKFVEMNLDGVLSAANMSDVESLLNSKMGLLSSNSVQENDSTFHPVLYKMAKSNDWMLNSVDVLTTLKGCFEKKQKRQLKKLVRSHVKKCGVSIGDTQKQPVEIITQPIEDLNIRDTKKEEIDENPPKVSSGGDTLKFYCDVCSVSCPDDASYTLHMSGRKHRNRLNHAREEEEKEVAHRMMNMKRMQLMNSGQKTAIERKIGAVLSTPVAAKSTAWASPQPAKQPMKSPTVGAKPRSNSLLGIMDEELQKASPALTISPKLRGKPKVTAAPSSGKKLSFSPQPWPVSSPNSSISLGSFIPLHDKVQPSELRVAKASWAATKPAAKIVPALPSNNTAKSFADIQREELDNRQKEDRMCHIGGNKWFVQQRDRAASIGEIQQREQEESEWQLLLEEQRQIEEAIARENKAKKDKAKKHPRRQQRKKPSNTAKPAKSDEKSKNVQS